MPCDMKSTAQMQLDILRAPPSSQLLNLLELIQPKSTRHDSFSSFKPLFIQFIMIAFTEIVGCNGTVIYEVVGQQMSFFTSGRFQVHIAYDGMVLLKLNAFEYSVNGSETILYDNSDPQFALILYLKKYPNDQWIVKINENADAVYSCLQEKCYLKNKKEPFKQEMRTSYQKVEPKVERVQDNHKVYISNQQSEEKEEKSIFVEASKQVNKGLKFTGGILSKGFEHIGGFIAKRMPKKEQTEVTSTTKENLKLATKTTKNVLGFASQQVGNLFRFGKQVASDVGERFQKSEKGKELKKDPRYESIKEGAQTGAGVLANLYDGVVGAVYSVGSGVAKGAGKVIGARYGADAGEAADEAFQGAGNAIKIMRVPADQMAKALKE